MVSCVFHHVRMGQPDFKFYYIEKDAHGKLFPVTGKEHVMLEGLVAYDCADADADGNVGWRKAVALYNIKYERKSIPPAKRGCHMQMTKALYEGVLGAAVGTANHESCLRRPGVDVLIIARFFEKNSGRISG